jgi:hypothetical protein
VQFEVTKQGRGGEGGACLARDRGRCTEEEGCDRTTKVTIDRYGVHILFRKGHIVNK